MFVYGRACGVILAQALNWGNWHPFDKFILG